jgi:hypothetical protein
MKMLFALAVLLVIPFAFSVAKANPGASYELAISRETSDGPFRGSSYGFSVSESGTCFYDSRVCDGPFRCSSLQSQRPIAECLPLSDAARLRNSLGGECREKSKVISSASDGLLKGSSEKLELTSNCVCQIVFENSDGPFKGVSEVTGYPTSHCRELLDPREIKALNSI